MCSAEPRHALTRAPNRPLAASCGILLAARRARSFRTQGVGTRDGGVRQCYLTFRARSASLSALDSVPAALGHHRRAPTDHAAHADQQLRRLPDLDARARVCRVQPAP